MIKCSKNGLTLGFNENNSKYEIECDGFSWISEGRQPYLIVRKKLGKKYIFTYVPFTSAKRKYCYAKNDKIIVKYEGFSAFGKKLSFTLVCTAEITSDHDVVFSLKAENETDMDIQAAYFPSPFNSKEKQENSYAVDTIRQGMIMPDGYNKNFLSTFSLTKYWRKVNTGDCYQPFWGRICGKHGFAAIIETPYDASMFSCFGKNRSFLNSVNWYSSLGKLSYERKIRFRFLKNCSYNDVAKAYRNYLIEKEDFLSIDDKIKINPTIKYLAGAPVLHHGIFSNINSKSNYYVKGGENQKVHATFAKRAEQLKKIKDAGLESLYIHTDGWGVAGYDNRHPYVLPPCEQAGGYDGMRELSQTCHDIGYKFGIHDQYRDYYYDCEKFDNSMSVQKIDGTNPFCDVWAGGAHTWLCSSKALEFVEATYSELKKQGVNIDGSYLDVFAIMWGDECFNKDHIVTREQSIEYRRQCFDYLRKQGIITSSEEAASQMINNLDLVHHSPYAVRPQDGGAGVGISVPLTNLVFHDCIFVPWLSNGIGGWGIPNGDSAKLHCILNAQTPYFNPFDSNDELKIHNELEKEIKNVQEISAINKKLYNAEMLSHCFVDGNLRKQRTVYSNGTSITVDFDKNTYEITEK